MIEPADVLERLHVQKQSLIFVLFDDGWQRDLMSGNVPLLPENPPRALAVPFGEALILCPSDESVEVCVKGDREGALAFIKVAEEALQRIEGGHGKIAARRREDQTPFFLLASFVREYMEAIG